MAAQIVAVAVVGGLFLVRLAVALYSAHEDGQAARHSTQDEQR